MESKIENGEVKLLIVEESPMRFCRICHEEEDDNSKPLEAPCACSGTLKFAHRGCVQRWCDEKGSTLCEICLQNFEPGYRLCPLKRLVDIGVLVRERLAASGEEEELSHSNSNTDDDYGGSYGHNPNCSPPPSRAASLGRSLAIAFTLGLLLRHFLEVLYLAGDNHTFPLFTVLLLRALGILIPFFVVMMVISTIEKLQVPNRRRWSAAIVDEMEDRQSYRERSVTMDQPDLESIRTQ